jgi:WD40 repeat protein/predicted Ser/Thr protein kinase
MSEPQQNEQDERALDALIVAALRQEDRDDQAPMVEHLPPLNDGEQAAVQAVEPSREEVRTKVMRAVPTMTRSTGTAPGPQIEGFEILRELGRGGMGVVYLARQLRPNRLVALKMIRAGDQADEAELARFRLEAETLARLRHPNIVQIYVVGEHERRPFLALEYIAGGTLAEKVERELSTVASAAEQVETLARAIHAVHERGVVHRDLKPENVLLDEDGTLKITDFGLAKKLDAVGQTASNAVMGTPSYMAPEQAGGKSRLVGPAADVYALGAILYKLLTGRTPFHGPTGLDMLRQVVSEEPVPPRRLRPQVSRDLQTICLKCLAKSPAERYADALALAEDLRHFRAGEPIVARPAGRGERLVKWWARQRPALAAAYSLGVLALGLAGGGVSALWLWQRAVTTSLQLVAEKQETELARQELALLSYFRAVELARREWRENEVARAELLLQGCPTPLRGWEWYYVRHLCHTDLHTLNGHTGAVWNVAFSPDGRRLASSSGADPARPGEVKVWDTLTGREVLSLPRHAHNVLGVAFSPDSRRLATASRDRTVKVWDAQTGQEVLSLKGHTAAVWSVAFSPDGTRLASASGEPGRPGRPGKPGEVKVWDALTGRETLTLNGHTHLVTGVAFSPDGRRLASASVPVIGPGQLKVWDAQTGGEIRTLKGAGVGVAFSPDGRRLASASRDGTVNVWDVQTGQEVLSLKGHTDWVSGPAFSPDGRYLASASSDRTVKIWDAETGQEILSLKGHTDFVNGVAFSPDGRVASASSDRTVKVWNVQTGQEARTLKGQTNPVTDVAFSPDGRRLASASGAVGTLGQLKLWDAQTGQEIRSLKGAGDGVAFSPDGRLLASASHVGVVKVWDADTGQEALSLPCDTDQTTVGIVFSPDSSRLACGSWSGKAKVGTVRVWDARTGQDALTLGWHTVPVLGVAFSPDGRRLASAFSNGTVKVWDAQTGQDALTLLGGGDSVAFSPDGRRLACASSDGTVRVWDALTGQLALTLKGHTGAVKGVVFSPDGRRLASASYDRTVKLWDAQTGHEALSLQGHDAPVSKVAFSPDGRRLASASSDKTVRIWDATPLPGDSQPPAAVKP